MLQAVVPFSPLLALASRGFQTSSQVQDVDSAAKFIGAGAATVGVAGHFFFLLIDSALFISMPFMYMQSLKFNQVISA